MLAAAVRAVVALSALQHAAAQFGADGGGGGGDGGGGATCGDGPHDCSDHANELRYTTGADGSLSFDACAATCTDSECCTETPHTAAHTCAESLATSEMCIDTVTEVVADCATGYVAGNATTPSTTCPSECTRVDAMAAACYGNASDPSVTCSGLSAEDACSGQAGCTLVSATSEMCIDTVTEVVADCATGYVAGNATSPSTTCPAECTLVAAAAGTLQNIYNCTGYALAIDGAPENITCVGASCTDSECCTVAPCTAVDTPYAGCTEARCTAVDTPYAGCHAETCAAVDTPYAGCTVPACTAADTPYAGCDDACTAVSIPFVGCENTCTAVDTPYAGCTAPTCTSNSIPYAGCTAPVCTAVDTPYAGCTAPACTAVDTPYAGCTMPTCSCTQPASITGYTVLGTAEEQSLLWDSFSVNVTCAAGYETVAEGCIVVPSTAAVEAADTTGCTLIPASTAAAGDCIVATFSPGSCTYVPPAMSAATTCGEPASFGGSCADYSLSGCVAIACTQPADITGYTVTNTQLEVAAGFNVTAACEGNNEGCTATTPICSSCSGWDCEQLGSICTNGSGYICCREDNNGCTDGSCWHAGSTCATTFFFTETTCSLTAVATVVPVAATCTETAAVSVVADLIACAAVTALSDNHTCDAVMSESAGAVAAVGVCTYTAGLAAVAGGMECSVTTGNGSCAYVPSVPYYYEATGLGPIATACTASGAYSLNGCTPVVCTQPVDITGYAVTETKLYSDGFNVTVLCAAGYQAEGVDHGHGPGATTCGATSGSYTLSGCSPVPICTAFSSSFIEGLPGYTVGNASATTVSALSATCAAGYSGMAVAECAGAAQVTSGHGTDTDTAAPDGTTTAPDVTEVVADCATGYVAGNATTPSTTCPSECTRVDAMAAACYGNASDPSVTCSGLSAEDACSGQAGCTLVSATSEMCIDITGSDPCAGVSCPATGEICIAGACVADPSGGGGDSGGDFSGGMGGDGMGRRRLQQRSWWGEVESYR